MDKLDQIFSATYSGVDVYELINVTGSVMRRRKDGWVNATHILKTANFPKAKRTRILERDVQTGVHEKVQGGYGKYQGTWVPLDRAKAIAEEYAVYDVLAPLFELKSTSGANSPPPAPKHHHASKNNSIVPKASTTKSTRATLARKTASMPPLKNTNTSPEPVRKKRGRPSRLNAPITNPNKGVFVGKRLKSATGRAESTPIDSTASEEYYDGDESDHDILTRDISLNDGLSSEIDENTNMNFKSPSSSPSEFMSDTDLANALRSPNQRVNQSARESLERAISSHKNHIRDKNTSSMWFDTDAEYISRLLEYFVTLDDTNGSSSTTAIPDFILNPPKGINFDQVIDEDDHTLFHWACSMGNAAVVESWINLGANYRAINSAGETTLMRSVLFTNSYNKRTFPKLVELLSEIIFQVDSSNKTVLHHIACGATTKSRIPSACYYMDILLARVSAQSYDRLSEFLNLQDNNGDTALHICAKNANRKCIKLLLEYKAKHNLKNNQGLIASDILLRNDRTPKIQQRYELHLKNQKQAAEQQRVQQQPDYTQHSDQYKAPSTFAAPHISEAAIEATHKVSTFLVESLDELSHSYDTELQRKEADVTEVEELLQNMNEDIMMTKLKTANLLNEELTGEQLQKRVRFLENEVSVYKNQTNQQEIKLRRLIERSQKRELELSISRFEKDEDLEDNKKNYLGYSDFSKLNDVVVLTKLQLNRKRLVAEIVQSQGVSNSPKMQKYKQLISAASDVPIHQVEDKIDGLLQEIEENGDWN